MIAGQWTYFVYAVTSGTALPACLNIQKVSSCRTARCEAGRSVCNDSFVKALSFDSTGHHSLDQFVLEDDEHDDRWQG